MRERAHTSEDQRCAQTAQTERVYARRCLHHPHHHYHLQAHEKHNSHDLLTHLYNKFPPLVYVTM